MSKTPDTTGTSPPAVVPARLEHVPSLVLCHVEALPGRVVTLLGPSFLRAHYRYYIRKPKGICFVAVDEDSDRVVGFVVGGEPGLRKRFIFRYFPPLACTFAWKALVSSPVRKRLAEGVRGLLESIRRRLRRRPAEEDASQPPDDPPGTSVRLLFLGVRPEFRRRGIARALVAAWCQECWDHGYQTLWVTTPIKSAPAVALYKEGGWDLFQVDREHMYFRRARNHSPQGAPERPTRQ